VDETEREQPATDNGAEDEEARREQEAQEGRLRQTEEEEAAE
jgi:hypothetical protein